MSGAASGASADGAAGDRPSDLLPADLLQALADVRHVAAITGAGVSAESGIPTYRGVGGIYDDPEAGARTVEALSGPTLQRDPDRTWRAVADLARAARGAAPNPAHAALVAIEDAVNRFVLLTQNVDNLHRLAGSRSMIEIHGDVFATRCMECDATGRIETREELEALDAAPPCPECDGVLRPDAVLFGEMLPEAKVERMRRELLAAEPELVLAVGTTALFPYIAEPVLVAAAAGRLTVEINPEPTSLTPHVRWSLRGAAGELLPAVAAAIRGDAPAGDDSSVSGPPSG